MLLIHKETGDVYELVYRESRVCLNVCYLQRYYYSSVVPDDDPNFYGQYEILGVI